MSKEVEISVLLSGIKQAQIALNRFHPTMQKKLERRAARKAAKVVQRRAIDRVPVDSGDLEESIKVRSVNKKYKVGASIVVGNGWYKGDQFYGSFIEFGAPGHKTFGRGKSPLEPDPFLRPAADESETDVKQIYIQTLRRIINETKSMQAQGLIDDEGKRIR